MKKQDFTPVQYKELRLSNLNSKPFRHLKLLLFWPIFGCLFSLVETGIFANKYYIVYSPLDDMIPFCEYFLIPYLFWFVFIFGMLLYTLLFDVDTFKKFMKYIILTYSITLFIYFLFPTAQNLRPASFAHDNIFTHFVAAFYAFDTNTNVCPSIHVIGSLAVMFAAWNSKHFRSVGWRIAFGAVALLICASTVFMKQHSILDVFAAIPLCLLAYPVVFGGRAKRGITASEKAEKAAAKNSL